MSQQTTKILIKGMVCRHCVEAVERIFSRAGLTGVAVGLGEAFLPANVVSDHDAMARIDTMLADEGFQRITDAEGALVERTKMLVIEHVRSHDNRHNLSACLADKLHTDYSNISKTFSAHQGRTIENYAIAQRIEFVKELLQYRQMNISEIADRAGYSSTAHLSRQFKAVTGLTPSAFVRESLPRIPLNKV